MSTTNTTKIAFVDTQVSGYQTLLQDFAPDTKIVLISGGDGLHQMVEILSTHHDLDAVYVVSHGSAGSVQLGNLTLDRSSLAQRSADLAAVGAALAEQGDLLLYGCDIAQGTAGQALVDQLAQATGADVAASDDLTGSAAKGGDWNLEVRSGSIETNMPFSKAAITDFSGLLAPTTFGYSNPSTLTSGNITQTLDGHTVLADGQNALVKDLSLWMRTAANETKLTFSFTDGEVFDAQSITMENLVDRVYISEGVYGPIGKFTLSDDNGHSITFDQDTGFVNRSIKDISTFTGAHKLYVTAAAPFTTFSIYALALSVNFPSSNTAPTISNLATDSVAWVNTTTALTLDQGTAVTISDTENDAANWNDASLSVQRKTTANTADVFAVVNGTNYTVSGSNLLSTANSNAIFGTASNSNGVLTVTFTGSGTPATKALVEDVMQHVTYLNATPSGDTLVTFSLNDGAGGIATADVTVASDTIYIDTAADTTTINTANGVSFSEAVGIALADTTGTQTLVLKNGLGNITLAGNLAITEDLTLNQAGTARILPGSTLTIDSNKSLTTTGAGLYLTSGLAGSGDITINNNAGTKVLVTGDNAGLTGTVTLVTGKLEMEAATALGSATIVAKAAINQGGIAGNSNAPTIGNAIKFFDTNAYLNVSGAALTFTAAVDLNGGAGHMYNSTGLTTTLDGVISNGSLSLERGEWKLTNTNTYSGSTTVDGSIGAFLQVDGSLANTSGVNLINEGRLYAGGGSVAGSVTVASSLSGIAGVPLSSASSMPLTIGGLTFSNGGWIYVTISSTTPGTGHSQFIVNGTVDVTGATLDLTNNTYSPNPSDSIVLIENDGTDPIVGQVKIGSNTIAEGGTFTFADQTFTLSYTGGTNGNDLVLNAPPANPDTPSVTTPTAIAFADTSATDTFTGTANLSGTLSATDGDGIASYGITDGTTGGSTVINTVTYDVSKAGTYGTLYVVSTGTTDKGKYTFVPNAAAINAVAAAATPSENFTVTATDSHANPATGNATLTVNVTGAGEAPTDIALSASSVSTYDPANATIGTLSATDVDGGGPTYSIVSVNTQTSGATFDLFNISGTTLRATDPNTTSTGTYAVVIRVNDGTSDYDKSINVSVSDTLIVTTNSDAGADATTGGTYAAELADGGGLSLREALALTSAGNKTIGFNASLSGQTITLGSGATVATGTTFDADAVGTLTIAGGTLAITGMTVTNGSNDTLTISNTINQNGGILTKTGAGKLVLSGTNGLGAVSVTNGTLSVSSQTNLDNSEDAASVILNGGTLEVNNNSAALVTAPV